MSDVLESTIDNRWWGLLPAAKKHRWLGPVIASLAARRELVHGASWSVVAAIVARGSNVLAMVLCARLLSQAKFGEVAIIQTTVGTFGPLAGLGLSSTTTKFLAEHKLGDPARAGRILALSLAIAGLAGALMTLAFIALAPTMAARGFAAPGLEGILIASSGLLLLGVVDAVQTGALIGLESFQRVARLSGWNGVLSVPVIGVLTYLYGVSGAVAGLTLSVALSCLLNAIVLRAECRHYGIRPTLRGCWQERSILFSFSLPAYISGLVVSPATWLASAWLFQRPGGDSEMALFNAADRFRFLLIFLPLSASRIAIPALSRYEASGDRQNFNGVFRWSLWLSLGTTVIPAMACVAMSPFLMSWYGADFRRGWMTLAIVAVSAIPTVFNTQLGYALVSTNRVWHRTFADFVLTVVFLICAWFMIPRWNSAGLAGSFAIAYTAACLTMGIWLRKDHAEQ